MSAIMKMDWSPRSRTSNLLSRSPATKKAVPSRACATHNIGQRFDGLFRSKRSMWDDGVVPTTANRELGHSNWLRWGVQTGHAGQGRRLCQWLHDQRWAWRRESAPSLGTGALG